MKLGLLSAILPEYSFRQVIDLCSEIGFSAVEVACWPKSKAERRYAGITHLDFNNTERAVLESEIKYAADKGITISSLGYYPNPLSADEAERTVAVSHIRKLIEEAAETGVGMVTTFIGRNRFETVEKNLVLYKEAWSPIVDLAEKKNVRIAIENCPMIFSADEWPGGNNLAATPAIWDEMFRLIKSDKLGLNFDPSHCVILDMDYIKPLYKYSHKIFHVHFKDTRVFRDKLDAVGRMAYPLSFMSPKLPGLGDIDWAAFCSSLYDIGFDGCACIEVEDRNFEKDEQAVRQGIELAYKNISRYF